MSQPLAPLEVSIDAWARQDWPGVLASAAPACAVPRYRALALVATGVALAALGKRESGARAIAHGLQRAVAAKDLASALAAALALRPLDARTADSCSSEVAALAVPRPSPATPPALERPPVVAPLLSRGAGLIAEAERLAAEASEGPSGEEEQARAPGFFAELDAAAAEALGAGARLVLFGRDTALFRQGDEADEAFLIVRGEVEARREGPEGPLLLGRAGAGALVGELALVTGGSRGAGVVATRPVVALGLGRHAFARLRREHGALAAALDRSVEERVLRNAFSAGPLLRGLDAGQKRHLLRAGAVRAFAPGESLVAQGETSAALFFLAAGSVRILREEDGESLELAVLGPGDVTGEVSLLLQRPAAARAVAATPVVALALPAERLLDALRPMPELFFRLYELASGRQRETAAIAEEEALDADALLTV